MRTKTVLSALVAFGLAAVLLSGCGGSGSDGSDGSGKADGSTTTEPSSSSDDGGGDTSAPADDVALPDGFPEEFAPPADTTLLQATQVGDTGSYVVVARVDGDPEEALDALKTQLTDADYEIVSSDFTPSDQGGYGGISAKGDDFTVAMSLGPDPTGDTTQLTINVANAE